MQKINKSILIKSSPEEVFSVVRDVRGYPKFIRDVKNVEVSPKSAKQFSSEWSVDIDGADVAWRQEDHVDEQNKRLTFAMTEGDYEQYSGEWSIEKDGNHARLTLKLMLDWGVPSFEKVIGKVLEKKTDHAVRGLLCAFKRYCESPKRPIL